VYRRYHQRIPKALHKPHAHHLPKHGKCISIQPFPSSSSLDIQRHAQANQINMQLILAPARQQNPMVYFSPVLEAYNLTACAGLETAIFLHYFHGKCQDANGVDPPGCPNPDCPKVCGTPGSLIHFYPTLASIVFNQTIGLLANLTTPGSKTYNQVLQAVRADANEGQRRRMENLSRIMPLRSRGAINVKNTQDGLKKIMKKLPSIMLRTCGGSELSLCS